VPLAGLYRVAVGWRNRRYDRPGASERAGIPVISVGNLTVGGTGKTPLVAWLTRHLLGLGRRPAVVSRGYGGRAGRGPLLVSRGEGPLRPASDCGDEPWLLARTLAGALVVVGVDRVAGAQLARREGADVVLLDDGFQHRRLARDLDIVLLDADDPFGGGRLLPAGLLREPPDSLRRADLILVTRDPTPELLRSIQAETRRHNVAAPLLRAGHRTVGFFDGAGRPLPGPARAVGFCGIGNPDRFRADLEASGLELVGFVPFSDHHVYSTAELSDLARRARDGDADLVTTEKDLARLGGAVDSPDGFEPAVLRIEARIPEPGTLIQAIDRSLRAGPAEQPA